MAYFGVKKQQGIGYSVGVRRSHVSCFLDDQIFSFKRGSSLEVAVILYDVANGRCRFFSESAIDPLLRYIEMGPNQRAHMCHVLALDLLLNPISNRCCSDFNWIEDEVFMTQLLSAWSLLIRSCKCMSAIDDNNPFVIFEGIQEPMDVNLPFWKHQRNTLHKLIDQEPLLILTGQRTLDLLKFYQFDFNQFARTILQALWRLVITTSDTPNLRHAIIELIVKVEDRLCNVRILNFVHSDLKDMETGLLAMLVHPQILMKQNAPILVLERQMSLTSYIVMIYKECEEDCVVQLVQKVKSCFRFMQWWESFKESLQSKLQNMNEDLRERAVDLITSMDEMLNSVDVE
eukprot:TRINITY_DN1080_c0_g1_i2.p1 TRINITY_DN1080_c0_g1~~TRINITY_DN1080_c0_g1_i2.p1  ORF type:complete len:345 (+),score=22.89 TRINITY_DN1080_c0_g1_i2:47-1081(+)